MLQIKVTSTQIVLTSVEGSWIFFFSSKGSFFFFSTWSEVNYDSPPAFRNEEASKSLQKSSCL